MECVSLIFSSHAVRRMFERSIREDEVRFVVAFGEVIADYSDDFPFASRLMLGFVGGRPLHIVVAVDHRGRRCYVITAYVPDAAQWDSDFKTRRLP